MKEGGHDDVSAGKPGPGVEGDGGGAPGAPQGAVRRFRDDEARAILARASWREGSGSAVPAAHDATLDDLMAAAAEAGLDPAEVRRAAALATEGTDGAAGSLVGPPPRSRAVLALEGVALPADRSALARAVERAVGGGGEVVKDPRGRFVWRSRGWAGGAEVVVSGAGSGVEVRVAADRGGAQALVWLGGLTAWALLTALTPLATLPLAAQLAGFLVAPLAAARPFRASARRRLVPWVERVALDVARAVEETAGGAA